MDKQTSPEALNKPWHCNPLRSKADVMEALKALVDPVEPYRSKGGARFRLGVSAAHFDQSAAEMEGFSRLLWGLVPAALGGATWIDWEVIRRGLANGCNPLHPEYWGDIADFDQRLVELAAIGFALRLLPEKLWGPLPNSSKQTIARYLKSGHESQFVDNNWQFFRLLLSMGMRQVGIAVDEALDRYAEAALERFYLADGWYQDGLTTRADHYVPFAFHFYGLILATFDKSDWTERYLQRAEEIKDDIAQWFSDDGAAICFGRSMTYRFAIAGFWAGLALSATERTDWGTLKGYYLRHLRWWSKQPFAGRDQILDIGYGYSNLLMSEPYNSPQSPYWALKAFLPLMLADDHPFWTTNEAPVQEAGGPVAQPQIGFLMGRPFGDSVALSSGQYAAPDNNFIHCGPEKYSKFAYSARYGFSVEPDSSKFGTAVLDNMIGFSLDGASYHVRKSLIEARCGDNILYSRWRPLDEVEVETWLYWDGPYQMRTHLVQTTHSLMTKEGGFAVASDRHCASIEEADRAVVTGHCDRSLIVDFGQPSLRSGHCCVAPPNSNLIAQKTRVPQLSGVIPAGQSLLQCAVLAGPISALGHDVLRGALPNPQGLEELRYLAAKHGQPVSLLRGHRPSARSSS